MTKSTHNGTCQVCGHAQAARGGDRLAKHGYTVDWGFFSGQCRGSDMSALEISRELLDHTVSECRTEAEYLHGVTAADIIKIEMTFNDPASRMGARLPRIERSLTRTEFGNLTDNERGQAYLLGGEWTNKEWKRKVVDKVGRLHLMADRYVATADSLTKLAADRHGEALIPRDNGTERKRLDGFDRYADAVAAAAELKADGWRTRVMGGRYDPIYVTATRKAI